MQTIGDLVADARERDGVLFRSDGRATPFGYRDFCTAVWKVGNLLRHYGVRENSRVAVVAGPTDPSPEDDPGWIDDSPVALRAFLGAAIGGAVIDLDPPKAVSATVLLAPNAWLDTYQPGPGCTQIAYGNPSADPSVAHLEREAWSENPTDPPGEIGPGAPVLATRKLYTHGDLLAESHRVVAEHGLTEDDTVTLRASLTEPGTVVAGLLAPMRVGATVLLGDGEPGTVAVASGDVPEKRVVQPDEFTP